MVRADLELLPHRPRRSIRRAAEGGCGKQEQVTPETKSLLRPDSSNFLSVWRAGGDNAQATGEGGGVAYLTHEPVPTRPITPSEYIRRGERGGVIWVGWGGGTSSCFVFPVFVVLLFRSSWSISSTRPQSLRVVTLSFRSAGCFNGLKSQYGRFLRE